MKTILVIDDNAEFSDNLAEFFETTTSWYAQIRSWPTSALPKFVRLGDKIRKLLMGEAK